MVMTRMTYTLLRQKRRELEGSIADINRTIALWGANPDLVRHLEVVRSYARAAVVHLKTVIGDAPVGDPSIRDIRNLPDWPKGVGQDVRDVIHDSDPGDEVA